MTPRGGSPLLVRPARDAAMLERSQVSAMVIAQEPEAVRDLVTALVVEVRKNAEARAAFARRLDAFVVLS